MTKTEHDSALHQGRSLLLKYWSQIRASRNQFQSGYCTSKLHKRTLFVKSL